MKNDNLLLAGDVKDILKNMGLKISDDNKPIGERTFSIESADISQVQIIYGDSFLKRPWDYDEVPINHANIWTRPFANEWTHSRKIFGTEEVKAFEAEMPLEKNYCYVKGYLEKVLQYKRPVDLSIIRSKEENNKKLGNAILELSGVSRLIAERYDEIRKPEGDAQKQIIKTSGDPNIARLNKYMNTKSDRGEKDTA